MRLAVCNKETVCLLLEDYRSAISKLPACNKQTNDSEQGNQPLSTIVLSVPLSNKAVDLSEIMDE